MSLEQDLGVAPLPESELDSFDIMELSAITIPEVGSGIDIAEHTDIHQQSRKSFKCLLCDRYFSYKSNMLNPNIPFTYQAEFRKTLKN